MNQQVSIIDNLGAIENSFSRQNAYSLGFENECLFARQQLVKNDFTLNTAQNNPNSLKSAILNVAAIGISLNPASAHAYLVPRDGAICLDISYRGLVKLATDTGAIRWAKAVLVYANDKFEMKGTWQPPVHDYDPFSKDRGDLIGGYCLAKLDEDYMVDTMTAEDIYKVRDTSKAFISAVKKGKENSVWHLWFEEMAKKTLVKRANKSWPQSGGRERMDKAISVLNEHEGLEEIKVITADYLQPTKEQTETYLELAKGDSVEFWLWYDSLDQKVQSSLPGCEFEPNKKGETMKFFNAQLEDGRVKMEAWLLDLTSLCDSQDDFGVVEFLGDLPESAVGHLIDQLIPEHSLFAQQATT